jgi:hypothetical protein
LLPLLVAVSSLCVAQQVPPGAAPQASPSVHPPFLIRADQDQISDKVTVHNIPDGSMPDPADFAAGLLTSTQANFVARPAITVQSQVAGATKGDFIVNLNIEGLMPFGESSTDLLYKGTQMDLLRFSRPGVGVGPASGTTFEAQQPGPLLLVLDNHSAFAYKQVAARLRFQNSDFCAFEVGPSPKPSGKTPPPDCGDEKAWKRFDLPQYAQITLRAADLPSAWFQDPGSGYARNGKSSGILTLHFTSSPEKIHEQNLPLEVQFDASTPALSWTLIQIFGLLALGAAASFLLRVSLPNMKRKRALKDQLSEINKLIAGLSGEVDSRVRTLLGSECLALDELRTEAFPVAPNYADYAKRAEQGLPILSRKVVVAQRLGSALERRSQRINDGYEYQILRDSGDLLDKASRLVQKDQIGDDDWIAINKNLSDAEGMLEEPTQQARDTFESALASRWQALREHFGPRDTTGALITGAWTPPDGVQDMAPLFKSLPKEFFAADLDGFKNWVKDQQGTGATADILVSALEYVTYIETIVPPKTVSAVWKAERDNLCDSLLNTTTQKLFDASDALWRLSENIFKDDVKQALAAGKAKLVLDPENPAVNQRFRISVCFSDPHLDVATARDQLSCRWTISTAMLGPRKLFQPWERVAVGPKVKHEEGWHAFHYFENRSVSADISVEISDGNDVVTLAANPRGEFPSITIKSTPNWRGREKYARTILEIAQLAAALLVPLAALASSTVTGGGEGRWWAVAGLGFGTDTIKNIILGNDATTPPPPSPPAK